MENTTFNLSSAQCSELKEIISSLVTKYEVEYIFCFGCSEQHYKSFGLLLKSYSDTRYKDDYKIVDHDADELCTQVRSFLEIVKKLCNKRLAEYRQDAEKAGRDIESYLPALPASLFI